jgi:hypothetical protein
MIKLFKLIGLYVQSWIDLLYDAASGGKLTTKMVELLAEQRRNSRELIFMKKSLREMERKFCNVRW